MRFVPSTGGVHHGSNDKPGSCMNEFDKETEVAFRSATSLPRVETWNRGYLVPVCSWGGIWAYSNVASGGWLQRVSGERTGAVEHPPLYVNGASWHACVNRPTNGVITLYAYFRYSPITRQDWAERPSNYRGYSQAGWLPGSGHWANRTNLQNRSLES